MSKGFNEIRKCNAVSYSYAQEWIYCIKKLYSLDTLTFNFLLATIGWVNESLNN